MILSISWKLVWNGRHGFQVIGPNEQQFVVYLQKIWCSCESWSTLTGVPYVVHSIASLPKKGLDPHDKTLLLQG